MTSGIQIFSSGITVTGNTVRDCNAVYQPPEPTIQDDMAEWRAMAATIDALPYGPHRAKLYSICAEAFGLIVKRIEKINGWT